MSRRQATTDVFSAIADPTRRGILQHLGSGEQPVMALAERFDVTLSAISQQLRILREVGLVTMRKEGREHVYRLDAAPLQSVADWVQTYEPFWSGKLDALGSYLDKTAGEREIAPLSPPASGYPAKRGNPGRPGTRGTGGGGEGDAMTVLSTRGESEEIL